MAENVKVYGAMKSLSCALHLIKNSYHGLEANLGLPDV